MARIRLKKETGSYIHFCHPYWLGGLMMTIGATFLLVSFNRNYQFVEYELLMAGLLFIASGFVVFIYRLDVEFMPNNRRYRVRRGFWPRIKTREGPYDELIGTVLKKKRIFSFGRQRPEKIKYEWTASFAFTSFEKPIGYFTSINEEEARFQFERFAKHFQTKAFDCSDEEKIVELNWNQISQIVDEEDEITQSLAIVDLDNPPETLDLRYGKEGMQIEVPILGLRIEFLFVLILGVTLTTVGIGAFFHFSERPELGSTGLYLAISVFVIGVTNFVAGLVGLLGRERLVIYEKTIHSDFMFLSMPFWEVSIPISDVEEIIVRENSSDRWLVTKKQAQEQAKDASIEPSFELVIHSDFQRILFGRHHEKPTLEWLRAALIHKLFEQEGNGDEKTAA